MLDIVAAVNNEQVLSSNLLRSPVLNTPGVELRLQKGYASAALAFRAAMNTCTSDVVVFVHQDVYLPSQWESRLLHSIAQLETIDPNWAVLGVYGMTPAGAHVGCVWSSGLDTVFGKPFDVPAPVESIDEVLIVLRRSSGVEFDPELPGYHLYATDLVQTALSKGLGAYAIYAPIIHNSRPILYLGREYFDAYNYVARKWRHRLPINNNVARVMKPSPAYLRMRARHWLNEWRHANVDRQRLDKNYDSVHLAQRLGFE